MAVGAGVHTGNFHIRLSPSMKETLAILAAESGVTRSEIVRYLILAASNNTVRSLILDKIREEK
jgi:predicted DNA-binding protein